MKLTGILLVAAVLQVSARTSAQTVTYSAQAVPLAQVFSAIEKQTGYNIFYNDADLQESRPVTVQLRAVPLVEALEKVLANQALKFDIQGNTIVITRKERITPVPMALPPTDIHGRITNELGEPLAGATVTIKGASKGTTTNKNGEFSIEAPDSKAILTLSYIGFETLELRAKDIVQGAVITMKASSQNLNEVVVNKGYYNEKREFLTGDVSTVTAKEIEEQPVGNVLAALQGRVPGLVVTQNTGVPGGSFAVQIRGKNSLINGNDPFFVVDGVPYNSQIPDALAGYGPINTTLRGGSPLDYINPFDIESVEVLKDADATAIYGSRAANGAILITTKKGKPGVTKVDINVNSGIGEVTNMLSELNTQQYLQMRHDAFKNDGKSPTISTAPDLLVWDTTRYTNWQKVLMGNKTHYSDAQLSFSGGNTNTQYLIGGGYHRETSPFPTILPGDGADQKASLHFNLTNVSANNKLRFFFVGSYVSARNTIQSVDFTNTALLLSPDAPPLHNPDGSLNWAPLVAGGSGTWANPFASLMDAYKSHTSNLVGNMTMSYTVLPGLEIKTSLGYTNTITGETQTYPTTSNDPGFQITSGNANYNTINSNSWIIEPQASYKIQLGQGVLNALIGGSFHENNSSIQTLAADGFSGDAVLENIAAATTISPLHNNSTQYKYNALYGRLNYNLNEKYIVNLTANRDGSSRFGPGKQFANFGSVGAGWIFSKEDFISKNVPVLSFGKLKASYGSSGNDQVHDYRFLDLYIPTQYPYQGIQGFYPGNLFNPDLAWEINRKMEVSLELGFFNNRINISASYFRNRSSNQLVVSPVSAVTGFASIPENLPATVQNTGQEYLINTVNIKTNAFRWSSSFNLTVPQNKLISFPNLSQSPYANKIVIGQPITIFKVVKSIGVNPKTGLYEYADAVGKPTYNPNPSKDATKYINTAPTFYGGFQNSISYKGFSLDFLFQFVKQTGTNILSLYSTGRMPGTKANQPLQIFSNTWQNPGDISKYEQFSQNRAGSPSSSLGHVAQSDLAYSDASFIRLKNLTISWQLPAKIDRKLNLQNCSVFFRGQNLLTVTGYDGLDPESQGIKLPPLRVFSLGFQVTL